MNPQFIMGRAAVGALPSQDISGSAKEVMKARNLCRQDAYTSHLQSDITARCPVTASIVASKGIFSLLVLCN